MRLIDVSSDEATVMVFAITFRTVTPPASDAEITLPMVLTNDTPELTPTPMLTRNARPAENATEVVVAAATVLAIDFSTEVVEVDATATFLLIARAMETEPVRETATTLPIDRPSDTDVVVPTDTLCAKIDTG